MKTTFENELRKVIKPITMDALYVGGTYAYIKLENGLVVRVRFNSPKRNEEYTELFVEIINPSKGLCDSVKIPFLEVWGERKINESGVIGNHKVKPMLFDFCGLHWFEFVPDDDDYIVLTVEVNKILKIYS